MPTQQQGQQLDDSQQQDHKRKQSARIRWLIASIVLVLIVAGTVIWVVTDQASLIGILPIVIFTVLGVVIGLFQWLFPVSSSTTEHHHILYHPSLTPQVSIATPPPTTTPERRQKLLYTFLQQTILIQPNRGLSINLFIEVL